MMCFCELVLFVENVNQNCFMFSQMICFLEYLLYLCINFSDTPHKILDLRCPYMSNNINVHFIVHTVALQNMLQCRKQNIAFRHIYKMQIKLNLCNAVNNKYPVYHFCKYKIECCIT